MRKELVSGAVALGLTIASIGSACQRPPETNPPPQRTPLAASGEPRPLDIEAEIQARVRATITAQQETTFKTTQPELELFEASSFEFKYPKGWIKEEKSHLPISFIDPKSAKDNPTKITFFISGNPFGSSADIDTLLEDIERREGMSLSRSNYKGPPPKAKQIPPVDRKPAYRISVERVPDPEGKPEYDLNTFIIFSAEEIVYFNLFTDPSVTDKIKPLFETVVRTFKERPVQRVEVPPKAPPPRAEAQKPSGSEKVAIRLKPEELSRALLTTPLENNELPAGFTSKPKQSGTLDQTAKDLGAIRQVNVLVVEPDPRFLGMPSGGISYTIFPDASRAKDAYNMYAKRSDSSTISDSPYPTVFLIEQSPFAKVSVCVVLVENTFIAATLTSIDQTPQEAKTVQLAQAGVKHLQRIGR